LYSVKGKTLVAITEAVIVIYLLLFGFSYQQKACKYTSNGLINKYFICFLSMLN